MKILPVVAVAVVIGVIAWFGWAAQHTTVSAASVAAATVSGGPEDIPPRTMQAYVAAAAAAPAGCKMQWEVIAGFGAIESGHGTYHGDGQIRTIGADGVISPPIIGIPIGPDTDDGKYDGDSSADHAVGFTQFIPSTWVGVMGDDRNPQNVDDAAEATVRKVCADASGPVDDRGALERAAYSYNHWDQYVQDVIDRVTGYVEWAASNKITTTPAAAPPSGEPTLQDVFSTMGASGHRRWSLIGDDLHRDGDSGVLDKAYSYADPAVSATLNALAPASNAKPVAGGQPPVNRPVKDGLICPVVDGLTVGDGWGAARSGHTHQGVDLFGTPGSPVVSPFDGTVVDVVNDEASGGAGGLAVVVRATSGPHQGAEVYMAHNEQNTAAVGQQVHQGQQVALVGNTGNARGGDTHVHLQWYEPGAGGPSPAEPNIMAACS